MSTFSYAQAAKGVSTPATTSKSASGSATPAKEGNSASGQEATASPSNWAEDVESESRPAQPAKAQEAQPEQTVPNAVKTSQPVDASNESSPDLASSTSSTVTKDDDVSSIPNASSESTTWDNKSQASTSVDKSVEPVEKTSDKVKKAKNVPAKPLQEAPVPTVNPWKIRADSIKSQVQKVAPSTTPNGVQTKKGDATSQEKITNGESRSKGRKEFRGDVDVRNGAKGKFSEKDVKAAPSSGALPPPPDRDQESWPTPETVIDEDRKKAQEKEKTEQKPKDGASTSKHEWVKIPYTPTVVFNTPLPNAAGARRGGRPGGRGGAPSNGRPAGFGTNGAEQTEALNGEQKSAAQDASPKTKRTDSPTMNGQAPAVNGDSAAKANGPVSSESEAQPRRSSLSGAPAQNGAYQRQYPNKPHKGRRGEFHGAGERRRDGASSPTKDNTWGERSAGTQTDTAENGERRAPAYQDGSAHGHSKRFSSFSSGREGRGRGGRGRGGAYTNGHHFTNGHSTSSFPLGPRSPTTFVPESNSFFPAPQGKYGRNSHRSQSLTTDPYRYQSFQPGYPAPIQTGHDMYPYGMAPAPMSAGLPYSPYGVDQYQIFSMITAQVEYYFSVDNLLKDMYLRRHMDSQGFVALEFIAGFNRIKNLSPDIDVIRLVCQQSASIEYRTTENGQDRLRRKDNWAQWVLDMAERDPSAQNEGPKELNKPQVSHPAGFDPSKPPQWSGMPPAFSPFGNEGVYPQMNGFHPVSQDSGSVPAETNGAAVEEPNAAVSNGQPIESSTKAVSGEPDSFSDLQLDSLTVVMRKQRTQALPPSVSRTFSNGSIDSKHGVPDEPEKSITCQMRVSGVGTPDG
ncbi:hypothetical protein CUC08_Gglean007672 [Alternaria sp. MG1]|nr:hypothetical protein CUC08_Gglean007672 [Alternaria sp. MG1]